ncbi:enoyl-CoA hydratase/isomerase family protein [Nocardia jiangxiensis]|uniref:enoyl-CoA hydratase/isomerase family protein n=1 Tax=Nocardia jiangxiensis TaxID=282685 RepID=UPI0002DEB129|nr:enoyl-CoA hydratase/isomerase family protein [Nocardia jiangxiensis]
MTDTSTTESMVHIDEGEVGIVTLSRPPVNAMSTGLRAELTDALNSLVAGNSSVIVIRGSGKGFCAGADVKEFHGRQGDAARTMSSLSQGTRFWDAVYDVQVPVVAAMHGFAVGAGLVMASLCDFRLASAECRFSMPEIAVGISVAGGGAQLRRLGLREGFLRDLLLNGETIDAATALREGLVDRVLPEEDFEEAALAWAKRLARHGRPALQAMKAAINLTESAPDWRAGNALTRSLSVGFVESYSRRAASAGEVHNERKHG